MLKNTKIIGALILFIFLLSGCGNEDQEASPYEDLFNQPTFSKITDSIRDAPKNDELYFHRAVLLNSNNYPEPALEDFKKAWAIKKEERYALGVGNLLLENKPDTAIAFLNAAVKEIPNSLLLQITLAKAYNIKGESEAALALCDKILTTLPQQVDVLKLKADILNKQEKPEEAIKILEQAYSLTPYDIALNYSLANLYAENNNPKVLRICDSLIKVDTLGQFAEPYYLKGIYYTNIEDDVKALSMFNTAIQKNYTFLNAYIEKGKLFFNQKKFVEALKVFQLCSSIKPAYPDAYYWIGMCQEATGEKENAYLNFHRAYELDKTFTEAKEAMSRVK